MALIAHPFDFSISFIVQCLFYCCLEFLFYFGVCSVIEIFKNQPDSTNIVIKGQKPLKYVLDIKNVRFYKSNFIKSI